MQIRQRRTPRVVSRPFPRRVLARAAALVALATTFVLVAPTMALAYGEVDVNQVRSSGSLGIVNGILIFAVAPLATLGLIMLIFLRPGSAPGAQRYRPGHGWNAHPTWIGVPERETHDEPALEGAEQLVEEAHAFEGGHNVDAVGNELPKGESPASTRRQGGAHGSW